MSPEAQRIAIAESQGWEQIVQASMDCWEGLPPVGSPWRESGHEQIPDYDDLNVIHELEKTIPHLPYLYRLQEACGGRMETSGDLARIIRATAAQRREAYLRCKGLWQDGKQPETKE